MAKEGDSGLKINSFGSRYDRPNGDSAISPGCDERFGVCEQCTRKLALMNMFEETYESLILCREEPNAVIDKTPFHVFVKHRADVKSKGTGRKQLAMFCRVL